MPKILIQTKMDLIQQQREQITFQDDFAKSLGVKIYKQISAAANKVEESIEAVMQICHDPSKGLSDDSLEVAKSQNEGSFIEDWFGNNLNFVLVTGAVCVGTSIASFMYKNRHRKVL